MLRRNFEILSRSVGVVSLGLMALAPLVARGQRIETTLEERVAGLETQFARLNGQVERLPDLTIYDDPCVECVRTGLFAGAALVYARPFINGNRAYRSNSDPTTVRFFDYEYEPSSRIWVGYNFADGIALRARYWQFEHGTATVSPTDTNSGDGSGSLATLFGSLFPVMNIVTNPGSNLAAHQSIQFQTVDVEAVKQFHFGLGEWAASIGVRHASFDQDSRFVTTTGASAGTYFYQHHVEATGPTLAMEIDYPYATNHGISVYGGVRGSVLFGDLSQRMAHVLTSGAISMEVSGKDPSHTIMALEGEFGLAWSRPLAWGGRLELRCGIEAQHWSQTATTLNDLADLAFYGATAQIALIR